MRRLRKRHGRHGRSDSPVWHEPAGALLEEGWYVTGPHGKRMGPFESSAVAWQQLRRARGW